MDGWSVTQYMNVYKGRLLKKSLNRKLKLVLSTRVIWDQFGCKLWLQSIQNYGGLVCLTSFSSFCANSIEISYHLKKKKLLVMARNLQSIKTLPALEPSQYRKSDSMFFLKRAGRCLQRLQPTWKRSVFVLARPTSASRAREQPQELGRWFCPLNLRLPSGTAFGEIARWLAGAQTWTQTRTLPTSCKGFIASKITA